MLNSNLLPGLWDLTLNVGSTGSGLRLVYKFTSVPPFQIHKTKIELFSFYSALWVKAKKVSINLFVLLFSSYSALDQNFTKDEGGWAAEKHYKLEERETSGFEQSKLENRSTRAQEILSLQNMVSVWIRTKPQEFPNSPWNGNSENFGLETLKQGVSDTHLQPRACWVKSAFLSACDGAATSFPEEVGGFVGTPTVTSPRAPLQGTLGSEHCSGSPQPCWTSWVLHSLVLVVRQVVERAALGRHGKVEAVGRVEEPVSFLAKDTNHLRSSTLPCSHGLHPPTTWTSQRLGWHPPTCTSKWLGWHLWSPLTERVTFGMSMNAAALKMQFI